MQTVDLPQGTIRYRAAGPADSTGPTVVFIHGLVVNHELWTPVADRLAARGIRSIAPDLPLGSHTVPLAEDADLTPRGVARLILDLLAALELTDVTLVGNDTGGALCQFVIDTDASRIGRLVLTNCDAFDKFPPPPFGMLKTAFRTPRRTASMMRLMRARAVRHSLLGYGGLVRSLDPEVSSRWSTPAAQDPGIARDLSRFTGAIEPGELLDVSTRLDRFDKPVRLVWGTSDRFFKFSFAERLAAAFPDATIAPIERGRTFVSLDFPDEVSEQIAGVSA